MVSKSEQKLQVIRQKEEALRIFKARIEEVFSAKDNTGRIAFSDALKKREVNSSASFTLATQIRENEKGVLGWERMAITKTRKVETLADVLPVTVLSKILTAIRELYAEDIAYLIPYEDAVKVALDRILFRPKK